MRNKIAKNLALLAIATPLAAGGTAYAAEPSFMHTGSRTTQPVGHYEFCQRLPGECHQITLKEVPIELTRKLWAKIIEVNNSVNMRVKPKTDMENYGVEDYWTFLDNGFGDCEDYALEKRRQLMSAGVTAGDLLLTVARLANGDGHAVLTVRTSLGDFILDNLEPRVLSFAETPYTYLKRQSTENSGVWVTINDGSETPVASVR